MITFFAPPSTCFSLVVFCVDTDDDSRCFSVLGWCRNDHFLCATLDVLQATLGGGEGASGLANVLNTNLAPWDLGWITGRRQSNGKTVYHETILGNLDCAIEAAMDGIVLKLVLHVLWRHRRVDVLQDEILPIHRDARDLAANAAEAVDAKLDWSIWVSGPDGHIPSRNPESARTTTK